MNDPQKALQELLGGGQLKDSLYPPTSRYHALEIKTTTAADGRVVPYLARRFVPEPAATEASRAHIVKEGDRLDNLAAVYLGDPEAFWRICDANPGTRPDELTEEFGYRIRIPGA